MDCQRRPLNWQGGFMFRRIIAAVLVFALPATATAGPLKEAAERAGRELAAKQQEEKAPSDRARFWTGIALIAGGGVLGALGAMELGDDESGPDDGEDNDDSDDGEDSDGWGNKALIGGGIAAAATGGWLLLTDRRNQGTRVSVQPSRLTVKHTVRF
jgi:hypothetical protein